MAGSARIAVQVVPRAAADRVGPLRDGILRIAVTRPPVDGVANRAVARLLAGALGVAPGRITLIHGERGRRKVFGVSGVEQADAEAALAGLAD